MEHLIELKDVYKIYHMGDEDVHALDGVSLTIDKGEFVAIVGSVRFRQIHRHEHHRLSGCAHQRYLPSGGRGRIHHG